MAKDHPDDSKKTPEEARDRIWELAEKIDICMFTTWDGARQRSRPLSARVERDAHAVYFLVDVSGDKNGEIEKFPWVSLAWADNSNWKYVVIEGKAKLSNDRAKIKELWEPTAQAWWKDENDPNIRVLKVTPTEAEFWDGPGRTVAMIKMMVAAATGSRPDMGENRKVSM